MNLSTKHHKNKSSSYVNFKQLLHNLSLTQTRQEVDAYFNQANTYISEGYHPYFLTLTINPMRGENLSSSDSQMLFFTNYIEQRFIGKYLLNNSNWNRRQSAASRPYALFAPRIYAFAESHASLSQINIYGRLHIHALVLAHPTHVKKLNAIRTKNKNSFSSRLSFCEETNAADRLPGFSGLNSNIDAESLSDSEFNDLAFTKNPDLQHKVIASADFQIVRDLTEAFSYCAKHYHKHRDSSFRAGPCQPIAFSTVVDGPVQPSSKAIH